MESASAAVAAACTNIWTSACFRLSVAGGGRARWAPPAASSAGAECQAIAHVSTRHRDTGIPTGFHSQPRKIAWRAGPCGCAIGITAAHRSQSFCKSDVQSWLNMPEIRTLIRRARAARKTCRPVKNCDSNTHRLIVFLNLTVRLRPERMRAPSRIFFAKPAVWPGSFVAVCCRLPRSRRKATRRGESSRDPFVTAKAPIERCAQSAAQQRLPGQTSPKFGAVQGLVRGANGRPVLGATVILRNVVTGQSLEKISNAQGVFRFIDVSPGTYDLNVVATGFKDFTNPGLQLKAGDSPVCEVTLIALPSSAVAVREVSAAPSWDHKPSRGLSTRARFQQLRPPRLRTRLSNRRLSRLRNSSATSRRGISTGTRPLDRCHARLGPLWHWRRAPVCKR